MMKSSYALFFSFILLNALFALSTRAQNDTFGVQGANDAAQKAPSANQNDGALNPANVDQAVDGSDNEKNTASKIPISKIITQEIAAAADPGYKKLAQQEDTDTQTMMENWDDTMANFVPSDAFNFEIPAGQFEIIYEDIAYLPSHIKGMYFISSSQDQEVDFQIIDPKKKVIFKRKKENEGVFHFDAQSHGVYGFAFNNRKGSGDIVVTFAIHVGNATGAYIQKEDVDPLELQVSRIEDNLLEVYTVTRIASRRQGTHYKTTLSNHDDIITWFAIECFAIVGTVIWEMYFIRKLLNNQRII